MKEIYEKYIKLAVSNGFKHKQSGSDFYSVDPTNRTVRYTGDDDYTGDNFIELITSKEFCMSIVNYLDKNDAWEQFDMCGLDWDTDSNIEPHNIIAMIQGIYISNDNLEGFIQSIL